MCIYICIDMYMYDDSIVHVYDIIKVHIIQLCHIYIHSIYTYRNNYINAET